MNKDKQIEEMAKLTKQRCRIDNLCGSCTWETCNDCLSEALYNAGYRKAPEVAREIFEEIESMEINGIIYTFSSNFAELKKKYTEEGK